MNSRHLSRCFHFTSCRPCLGQRSFASPRLHQEPFHPWEKNRSARIVGRSGINPTYIVIITFGCLLSGVFLLPQNSVLFQDVGSSAILKCEPRAEHYPNMVGKALPGRPGTLTNDQEVKLQEFWNATLKVFGVEDPESNANGVEENDDDQHSRPETFSSEKQKKKKRSMFGRKHQGDDAEAGQQQSLSAATDPEDKYGQTKAFHHVVATQSPESLRRAFWSMVKHDHPDGLLLRFLRARKWDVQHALVMLISTMHWRLQEMNVDDDLMKNGEGAALADSLNPSNPVAKKEGNNFLTQLRMGKSYLHGTDREGRPMCFVRVRLHKQGEQSEASLERFTVYVIETARLLLAANVDTAVSNLKNLKTQMLNPSR